jgi:hypothetical protein
VKVKEEKESLEYEEYEVTGVKRQERLAIETEEMCNAEIKVKNIDKSDGLNRVVLNFKKNGFPKLQNKTKGKASKIRSNQRSSLIGLKTVTNDDSTLNVVNVWDQLEQNHDQVDMPMEKRLMSLQNFGVFKDGVRDVMSNEIKVVTRQFKENKEFNQELSEKNVVYWTKKYYFLKLHTTYILYKEPNEGILRTEMALIMRSEGKGLFKATKINTAAGTPDHVYRKAKKYLENDCSDRRHDGRFVFDEHMKVCSEGGVIGKQLQQLLELQIKSFPKNIFQHPHILNVT